MNLAEKWHPTKNGAITPQDVSSKSHKKYWFKCEKGHEWQIRLQDCTQICCPYCRNRRACQDNCLETLFPKIAAQWHPVKNGKITPRHVVAGSTKKYWFQCSKGHEWKSGLRSVKRGCPYCANHKVCVDNCLSKTHPEIAAEWHPTKNGHITPNDVVAGNGGKFWFQCEEGHIWKNILSNRTRLNNGCPYCSRRLVCDSNCLEKTHPEIAAEWHPTKNTPITPKNVIAGSDKKYWFVCKNGHEWIASLNNRTHCKCPCGCPRCCESKGEKKLVKIAEDLCGRKIISHYVKQYKDPRIKCVKMLPFDIALFAANKVCVVEFHGRQHYEAVNWSGKMTQEEIMNELHRVKAYDKIKRNFCKQYGIKYLAIHYKQIEQMQNIIVGFLQPLTA